MDHFLYGKRNMLAAVMLIGLIPPAIAVLIKARQHLTTRPENKVYLTNDIPALICGRRAHFIKPASFSCQPDKDSPMRISY